MSGNVSLRTAVFGILLGVLIAWAPTQAVAEEIRICVSPTIHSEIKKSQDSYVLQFVIKNESASKFSFEPFYFGENMLHLRATDSAGRSLQGATPLLGPSVGDLVLSPGKSFVKEIRLDDFFPKLRSVMMTGAIKLNWELSLHGKNSCSSQIVHTSMTLEP